jgi:hypothetical protein
MKPVREYRIVANVDWVKVEKLVQEYMNMNQDWYPIGGVMQTNQGLFMQAIARERYE